MSEPFIKVMFPDSWSWCGEPTVRIIDDKRDLTKTANTIFGCEYEDMKPDKDHVGIHLVALGDYEHYGLNRNFDGFSKSSCEKYHPTFVKFGHVFEHHKNKDPKLALGNIVKSAYSRDMGRVELMIHAHREKAAEHLKTYEKEGTVSFSMACKIPFDTCTKCKKHRKNRKDPEACDHLKYEFGKTEKDGSIIGTMNPDPLWFDISFVKRPADRIAWDLKKVASIDDPYHKWATDLESGLVLPDRIAISTEAELQKRAHMEKIAEFETNYTWNTSAKPKSKHDQYIAAIKYAGVTTVDDATINELRAFTPGAVFSGLAEHGIVLSPVSFFKYAFGTDFGEYAITMPDTLKACATVFRNAVNNEACGSICSNDRYDVKSGEAALPSNLLCKLAAASSVVGDEMLTRAVFVPAALVMHKIAVDKTDPVLFNSTCSQILATEYAAYKVAAVQAVVEKFKFNTDTDSVYAVTASQNLVQE